MSAMMLAVWMALPGVWETNPSALHRGHFAVPSGLLGQSGLSLDRDLVRSAGSSGTWVDFRRDRPAPRLLDADEFTLTMTNLLQGHGTLTDLALWFATARVQVDVAQNRFFVTLRLSVL